LEDYAGLADALVTLHQSQFDERWIDEAVRLADEVLARFTDEKSGGFYTAAADHGSLLVRKKDLIDSSTPSGGGLAASALLRLGKLCGRSDYAGAAEAALRASAGMMERMPTGFGQMLLVADMHLGPTPEVVIAGSGDAGADAEVLAALGRLYLPSSVAACRSPSQGSARRSPALAGLFEGKTPTGDSPSLDGPTLYVCENSACRAPVHGASAVLSALAGLTRPGPQRDGC
jgi:uncharacterized protein YyaL (SSP411 family)